MATPFASSDPTPFARRVGRGDGGSACFCPGGIGRRGGGRATLLYVEGHAEGFYCALLNGDPQAYTIRARLFDGREIEIDDPYRSDPRSRTPTLPAHRRDAEPRRTTRSAPTPS